MPQDQAARENAQRDVRIGVFSGNFIAGYIALQHCYAAVRHKGLSRNFALSPAPSRERVHSRVTDLN